MEIINPRYKLQENNIFNLRKNDLDKVEQIVRNMLIPAEEIGFEVIEFGIKNVKSRSNELFKTISQKFIVKLRKNSKDIDLSLLIPRLIDDNYFIIGGKKKLPLFQMFDIPIVTRGKTIKLRTNILTFVVEEFKKFPFVRLSAFGRKVPLVLIILCKYGIEETRKMFDLDNIKAEDIKTDTTFGKLIYDLKDFCEGSEGFKKEDFLDDIAKYLSFNSNKSKASDFMYSLDLISKIDLPSKQFFHTENIIDELIYAIKSEEFDDINLINKRVRCFEYIILSKYAKIIFDFCVANRTTRKPKFNINTKQILSESNISDIIQFDFSINPIEELTKLSRISLLGPGGFKKANVPRYLRDIDDSMFGRVCVVDTPDRENCGILHNLLPNVKLDNNLKFSEELAEEKVSIPVSFTPFLRNNDQTRLQMAASQMRQAILLTSFDKPMIEAGVESLYSDKTQSVRLAKNDGKVVFVNNNFIIVKYIDGEDEIFNIGIKNIYTENLDYYSNLDVGSEFQKGDIIVRGSFISNEEKKIIFGRNLLTAVMPFHGFNYEDGIVISDRVKHKFRSIHHLDLSFTIPPDAILLSLSDNDYIPLPNPDFQKIFEEIGVKKEICKNENLEKYVCRNIEQPYAIMKKIPNGPIDYYTLLKDSEKLYTEKTNNVLIYNVELYVNTYNDSIKRYADYISKKVELQINEEKKLQNIIYKYLPEEQAKDFINDNSLDKFSNNTGKFKIKGELINGIYVKVDAFYTRELEVGDKIGNRHGNKGTISNILPYDQMPKLKDGRHVDICLNPLGFLSRMNFGQLFELHLTSSLNDLKTEMFKRLSNKYSKENQEELKKYLSDYIKIIDNTNGNWYYNQFCKELDKIEINKEFIEKLNIMQPPFESSNRDQIIEALKYTQTRMRNKLKDMISGEDIQEEITTGWMYFFKMVHIAEEKLSARSIGGNYLRRTFQPISGRKNKGGQRCGEMETACIIAHNGLENLNEMITLKSDCIELKSMFVRSQIDPDFSLPKEIDNSLLEPESVKLLKAYMTALNLNLKGK